jgi:alanyl-tRNA synthetase
MQWIESESGVAWTANETATKAHRVLADHGRGMTFLVGDGVTPSNEGRGYVLRRILRRAVRHAWLLGRREPTLAPLTEVVVATMGDVYPELRDKAEYLREVTETEEERFLETIDGGLGRLENLFASGASVIPGDEAFRLYDTYGFPIDLTQVIASERGVGVDVEGFERALEGQRTRSRAARRSSGGGSSGPAIRQTQPGWRSVKRGRQKFVGYEATEAESEILAFRNEDGRVDLLLHRNPFYAEAGGQVSDTGLVVGEAWSLPVDRVSRVPRGVVVSGPFEETFEPTDVRARVDEPRRRNIERNHSATHLVHAALRRHLGSHVRQQGSLVEAERLRFDFSHHGPIDPELFDRIEREVNEQIWVNHQVRTEEMPYPDAIAMGAMAFFAEKYGDRVRVVTMGPSIELCGGTHVDTTGALGLFRFTSQGGVAAGVRRIEAVTGSMAYAEVDRLRSRIKAVATSLRAQPEHVARRVEQLLAEQQKLQARLAELLRSGGGVTGEETTLDVAGLRVTVADTASEDRDELGSVVDRFRSGKERGVLVLFGESGIHVAITDDLVRRGLKAGELVNRIAAVSGGRGGGRPHFASAGVGDPARLPAAREAVMDAVTAWHEGA